MKVAMNNTVFSNNGFPPINYDLSEGEKNLSPKFDWAEALKGQVIIDDWGKLPIRNTSTPVLCKDGTTKNQPSSPTAKYEDACRDNGGRAEQSSPYKQGVTMKLTCKDGTTGFGDYSKVDAPCKNNGGVKSLEPYIPKEPIYYILVTAGVLVAGYFAYKKFKK
jgi:hypothetical protein